MGLVDETIGHPLIKSEQLTCIACPEQWEGQLLDGRFFYFRLRHGVARLGTGDTLSAAVENAFRENTVTDIPGPGGCFLNADDRYAVFNGLLQLR